MSTSSDFSNRLRSEIESRRGRTVGAPPSELKGPNVLARLHAQQEARAEALLDRLTGRASDA